MAIPALDADGFLPEGIHPCTLEEMKAQFGSFQKTDRRPQLFAKLAVFAGEVRSSQIVRALMVDGSFVTAEPTPNDIDLILVVPAHHDFSSDLSPAAYNVLSKRRVYRRFGFDLLVGREGSAEYHRWIEFFTQVRLAPGRRKGMVSVAL